MEKRIHKMHHFFSPLNIFTVCLLVERSHSRQWALAAWLHIISCLKGGGNQANMKKSFQCYIHLLNHWSTKNAHGFWAGWESWPRVLSKRPTAGFCSQTKNACERKQWAQANPNSYWRAVTRKVEHFLWARPLPLDKLCSTWIPPPSLNMNGILNELLDGWRID